MTELDPSQLSGETVGVSRRNVLRMGAVAAWTVPVIVTLQASPAGAASPPPGGSTEVPVSPPTPAPGPNPPVAPVAPPDTPEERTEVKPETVVVTPPASPGGATPSSPGPGDAAAPTTDTPSGGLAFTGAEIGGLVVLGTGAVALGTAAVWSARRRDDDDEGTAAS
jgi:hypothetical protein